MIYYMREYTLDPSELVLGLIWTIWSILDSRRIGVAQERYVSRESDIPAFAVA